MINNLDRFSNEVAIVGAKGFIGSNLAKFFINCEGYTRENISNLKTSKTKTIILAAAPAKKWKANKYPVEDMNEVKNVYDSIAGIKAQNCILISTIDIFPTNYEFDEDSIPPTTFVQGYGNNRAWLETRIRERFERTLVVRLPGMYGLGLKKNILFDLQQKRSDIKFPNPLDEFQWLDVQDLGYLICIAYNQNLETLNVSTEPTIIGEIAKSVFGFELEAKIENPILYRMSSKYVSQMIGKNSPYFFDREEVFLKVREWKKCVDLECN